MEKFRQKRKQRTFDKKVRTAAWRAGCLWTRNDACWVFRPWSPQGAALLPSCCRMFLPTPPHPAPLQVRYESRKKLAEARPRIKGQFVKQEVATAYHAAMARGDVEAAEALLVKTDS